MALKKAGYGVGTKPKLGDTPEPREELSYIVTENEE